MLLDGDINRYVHVGIPIRILGLKICLISNIGQISWTEKPKIFLDLYAVNDTYNIRMSKSCGGDKLNLEYLKNVVLRYMLSSDTSVREHMLKAIGAVLVFTKSEAARTPKDQYSDQD